MARIAKSGLEYFPFDIDFFQDIRIRKLIKRQGGKAVTVYALLLCLIYKDGYYMRWDTELPFICSETTGFEEAYISEVIKSCLSLGLFDKQLYDSDQVLSSKGIQVRYCNIQRLNRRMTAIDEYSLIETKEKPAKKRQAAAPKPASKEEKPSAKPAPEPPEPKVKQPARQRSLKEINAEYMQHFFSENRKESLTALCKNLKFKKPDFIELRKLADAVIAEWELSEVPHTGFTDWSRHLIATMRIRVAESKKQNRTDQPDTPKSDYSFKGGFGGQDV